MRTILMALVLGLICTTTSFAQSEKLPPPPLKDAPPAPVIEAIPAPQEAVPVTPAPETVIVEESVKEVVPAPVCVGNSCQLRKIQPVRNLVVKPVVPVVKGTACAVKQVHCRTVQRVQTFSQCRPRLFVRRCR